MTKFRSVNQSNMGLPGALLLTFFLTLPCQVSAAVIEEIVVTATKRSENVQDIGVSVAAFTGDEIGEYRFDRFWDISNQSPNIDITSFLGNSRPTISIRGGEIQSFSAFDEISVGVYQDGVYFWHPGPANSRRCSIWSGSKSCVGRRVRSMVEILLQGRLSIFHADPAMILLLTGQ